MATPRDVKPAILFVALQTGAGANGGIASMGEILLSLDRYRPVLLTNLDSPIVEHWRTAGIEVHVVPEGASRGIRNAPLAVAKTYVRYFFAVRRLIRRTGACIVHANDPLAFQLAVPAVRSRPGVRLAFSVRDTLDPQRPVPRRRLDWLFGAADHVFFLSHDMRERWIALSPAAALRSSATYSIVDFNRFAMTSLTVGAPRVVLVSGVVSAKKGQLRFLQYVAPALVDAGLDIWLSGDFDPVNSPYAARCLAAAEPLGPHVKFLGYRPDMPDLVRRAHVICITSQYEGLMRTMIEAVSMGRPVVSTDVASAREILEQPDRRAGYVFPLDFDATMAETIIDLCRDEALNARLGSNGAAIARELFRRERVLEAYQDAYDALVDARSHRPDSSGMG